MGRVRSKQWVLSTSKLRGRSSLTKPCRTEHGHHNLPFVLTIEGKDDLWDFIRGDLLILVLIEWGALCQIALDKGYEAKFERDDESYPLRVDVPGGDDMSGISTHILARIGMEFVSPEWIVLSSIEMNKATA